MGGSRVKGLGVRQWVKGFTRQVLKQVSMKTGLKARIKISSFAFFPPPQPPFLPNHPSRPDRFRVPQGTLKNADEKSSNHSRPKETSSEV